jgi:hypothetical protein
VVSLEFFYSFKMWGIGRHWYLRPIILAI